GALLAATAAVQREGIPVMLVLCGLPTILENLGRSKSYSERMFTVEHIGHLHPPEDRLAFTGPAEARGRRFTDQVVEAVLLDTQGYRFFIQLYGAALWRGTNAQPVIAEANVRRVPTPAPRRCSLMQTRVYPVASSSLRPRSRPR